MTAIRVTCQHCSFSRDVPEEKIPDRPVPVTCPKCAKTFTFHKSAIMSPQPGQAILHSLPAATGSEPPGPTPLEITELPWAAKDGSPLPPGPKRPPGRGAPLPEGPVTATKAAPLVGLILLFLAVMGASWWLNFPTISSVPVGAYRDTKNAYAVKAPAEWLLITPENHQSMATQFSDKIPKEFAGFIGKGKPGFSVSFLKIPAADTDFAPNFNLSLIDTKGKNLPALTESEKDTASKMIAKEFTRMLPQYRLLESRIIQVDGVNSLQITGEAELVSVSKKAAPIYTEPGAFGMRRITGYTEEEKQTYKIRAIQTMIPGKKRAYALNYMFDDLKTPEMGKLQAEVIETFRLLERPPRFGGIVMGGLNGGLFGMGLYLFGLIIGRLFRSQTE